MVDDVTQNIHGSSAASENRKSSDRSCGMRCYPACLQPCADIKLFVLALSSLFIFMGSFFAYRISVLSTLEKRFEFPSKTAGMLLIFEDMTQAVIAIGGSHFGGRSHRPRIIALLSAVFALGVFLTSVPHYIYGGGTYVERESDTGLNLSAWRDTCVGVAAPDTCDDNRQTNKMAIGIIIIGQLILGIGNSSIFSLGSSYVDDNVDPANAAFYLGITYTLRLFGPALGFVIGSVFTRIYVTLSETNLTPSDPAWIGAWWLGFLLIAVLLWILAIPMAMFPKHLANSAHQRDSRVVHDDRGNCQLMTDVAADDKTKKKSFGVHSKGLVASLRRLLTNRTYILVLFGAIFDVYIIVCYFIFLPKYLEAQFRIPAHKASMYTGVMGLMSSCLGILLSAYFMKKAKIQPKGAIAMILFGNVITITSLVVFTFLGCDNVDFAGGQLTDSGYDLTNNCSMSCECDRTSYAPVCGADGITYFSGCYAGCERMDGVAPSENYSDCACVGGDGTATHGTCDIGCSYLTHYLVVLAISSFVSAPTKIASITVKLRVVDKDLKSLALGFTTFCLSLFVFIPGPVISGSAIDTACILWQVDGCGKTGSCWKHDNDKFRYILHGIALGVKCVATCFYTVAYVTCKGSHAGDVNAYETKRNDPRAKEEILDIGYAIGKGADAELVTLPII
ncbi:PREDICTED: solute carrier organic anion transporter family member 3A1-like [Priapulus caudatus]|uniref:Solute carrier organic anion transporter family member n=1 Tax=Priapulus caudatus TaxID=37621 RepID=A0ABM1DU71_PRICU|nr:PREDICTED: solute carrier organic anion transporter family member 3A1-like [Priapulus caudatus]